MTFCANRGRSFGDFSIRAAIICSVTCTFLYVGGFVSRRNAGENDATWKLPREIEETYPIRNRQTSLAVFFSRKLPTFCILERREVA